MMPPVPPRHASVNIHKKRRSSTIATNFQSSITCSRVGVGKSETKKEKRKEREGYFKRTPYLLNHTAKKILVYGTLVNK